MSVNTSESVTSEYQLRSFFDVGLFEVTCIVLPGNHKHIAIFQCVDNTIVIDPISLLNRYGGSVPILDNCKIHFISFKLAPTHF